MGIIPEIFEKYAILPLYPHQPAPSNAIAVGDYNTIMSNLPDTQARFDALARADETMSRIEATEQEQAITRAVQVAVFADALAAFERRLDAYIARQEERTRKDAEEQEAQEQQRIQHTLDQLPDPDDPLSFPGGELSPIPPSHPEDKEQLSALDQGALPNELQEGAPADPGTSPNNDPEELGHAAKPRNVVAQPIAISLNEDD